MAAFQDLDWSWLKNISQRLTESSLSAIHKLFEPGYVDNLLGKTATDAIRVLVDNEYLSTGAFLLICGSLLGPSHTALSNLQSRIWNAISVSVTIEERDEVYQALEEFLADISKHGEFNNLIATTVVGSNAPQPGLPGEDQSNSSVKYTPGYGSHSIHFKGKKIRVRKDPFGTQSQPSGLAFSLSRPSHRTANKMISLWTLSRNPICLQELIDEAITSFHKKYDGKIQIYQYMSSYNRWSSNYCKQTRDLHSVVLPVGLKEDLITDIKRFFESSKLYRLQSIPYRRTYLFVGPPGTGKSSLVQALASHFYMHICTINLSDPTLTEPILNSMMNTIPQNSMILIEDVDAIATGSKDIHNGLSWHSLLNSLDGVASQEGTIVFMTTNSFELLDAALLRPGRVDKQIPFNLADDFQIRQMFTNFFGQRLRNQSTEDTSTATYGSLASFLGMKRKVSSFSEDASHKIRKLTKNDLEFYSRCFANYIRPYTVSPAEIQAFFLSCRDDDIEVIAHKGNEFLESIKSFRPPPAKTSSQTHPIEQLVVVASQTTPIRSNAQNAMLQTIQRGTPTKAAYEQKAIEEALTDPSSDGYEQDELSQEDTDGNQDESEDEETYSNSDIGQEDEQESADKETDDDQEHGQRVEENESEDEDQNDDNDELESDEEIENQSEACTEGESNGNNNATVEADDQGKSATDSIAIVEAEVEVTTTTTISICEESEQQQPLTNGISSESDAETIAQPEGVDITKEEVNESNDFVAEDNHISTDNQAESQGNKSDSEQSELDLTPTGKQVESMPYPSPKKQEKVVADVLKHKMSRGLSFLEATDIIFKEGIQGVDAAVINRVLGEKSVTPIKRAVNRKPSFQAKRASHRFNRRLKRERSKQKVIADENEWRDEKLSSKHHVKDENPSIGAVSDQGLTGQSRKKVHYENDSPLRKFANSQKHTSLHKAANLPSRLGRKSLLKSPKHSTASSDPQDSSEYDSGTERARKELDAFLQRKANTKTERK